MQQAPRAALILSAGLAVTFIALGVDKYLHPLLWYGWLPQWMDGALSMDKVMWLKIIAGLEVLMGVMLIVPVHLARQAGSVLIVLHLLGICAIVFMTSGWNDILMRDIGLLAAAVALSTLL